MNLKQRLKDIFKFSIAGFIVTLFCWLIAIVMYDWLGLSALKWGLAPVPFTFLIRYIIYGKVWRKNENRNEEENK